MAAHTDAVAPCFSFCFGATTNSEIWNKQTEKEREIESVDEERINKVVDDDEINRGFDGFH